MAQYYQESKITYQQLIFQQIQKIQNICSKELRDGEKTIKNLLGEQIIDAEDTRYSFLQSVELLGSMLCPWFGKGDISKSFANFCDLYDMELKDALLDEDFQEELAKMFNISKEEIKKRAKDNEELRTQSNIYFLNHKIKQGRRIFRELIILFKDNDFLSGESFGEGPSADEGLDAIDDEGSEDEIS